MSFVQKTWLNKDSNGNIPTSAPRFDSDNMNRIEQGIADSLKKNGGTMNGELILKSNPTSDMEAATKKYVDESLQLFSGSLSVAAKTSINTKFSLPTDLDLSRYIGLFMALNARDAGGSVVPPAITILTPNSDRIVSYTGSIGDCVWVKINTSSNVLQFSGYTSSSAYSTHFLLLLIPYIEKGTITTI